MLMRTRRALGRLTGDEGVSLVEVMVSMTVLAVVMSAVASSVIQSLTIARDSRESVLAANIAQFELERLRAIPFLEWVQSAQDPGDVELTRVGTFASDSGLRYTIDRSATWVSSGADTDGCDTALSGEGSGADYILVRQVVSFPDRDLEPVETQTIVTPRIDFFDPYSGNLAVVVRDRDGVGVPNISVAIAGYGGSEVGQTDANGCAFFAFLTVDGDNPANNGYDITIDREGWIDRETGLQAISDTAFVGAQTTTVVEYEYDEGVAYALRPTAPAADSDPAAGSYVPYDCTVTLVELAPAGSGEYALECHDNGTGTPVAGWQPRVPAGLGWVFYNANYNALGWFTPPVSDPAYPAALDTLLYPFNAGFGAHAGACLGADPNATGGTRQVLNAEPGSDVEEPINLAFIEVENPDTVQAADIYADMVLDDACPSGQRLYLGQAPPAETLQAVLPYGEWAVFGVPAGNTPPTGIQDCSGGATCFSLTDTLLEGVEDVLGGLL